MNNAVAAVSSAVSGEFERTVISDLGVPLDYFEFRPPDPSDPLSTARLAAGWQIGRKTFVVVNTGPARSARPVTCQSQAPSSTLVGASLQFRLSSEWRTEASIEPVFTCTPGAPSISHQFGLDLFWERRY